MTQSPVKHRNKAEWPSAESRKVLSDAMMVGHDEAIEVVTKIRDELFGNADKMDTLATKWGQDKTMIKSKDDIDDALERLSGYWQGGGFDSFSRYSLKTSGKIADNESQMNGISDVMANCVGHVYNTYGMAIRLLSTCAHDLNSLGIEHLAPVVGQLAKVLNTLNDFVKAWYDLLADAVDYMGQLMKEKASLGKYASDFVEVKEPGADDPDKDHPSKNPDLWDVKPNEK
jgi:hypothetical protein